MCLNYFKHSTLNSLPAEHQLAFALLDFLPLYISDGRA